MIRSERQYNYFLLLFIFYEGIETTNIVSITKTFRQYSHGFFTIPTIQQMFRQSFQLLQSHFYVFTPTPLSPLSSLLLLHSELAFVRRVATNYHPSPASGKAYIFGPIY